MGVTLGSLVRPLPPPPVDMLMLLLRWCAAQQLVARDERLRAR